MGLTFGVLVLASYRLTRALTVDAIADRIRTWALARYGEHGLGKLVTCPWCAGWWISGAVVAGAVLTGELRPRRRFLLWWPAVAGAAGLVNAIEAHTDEAA